MKQIAVVLSMIVAFLCLAFNTNAATVTYVFGPEVNAGGLTGSGTMTFAAPPADSTSEWSSTNATDLIDWSFTVAGSINDTFTPSNFTGYDLTYNNPQSLTGGELDSGSIFYNHPTITDAPTISFGFSPTPGNDSVVFGGLIIPALAQPFQGDWTAVPIPPTLYLLGSGILGLIGMARYKKAT